MSGKGLGGRKVGGSLREEEWGRGEGGGREVAEEEEWREGGGRRQCSWRRVGAGKGVQRWRGVGKVVVHKALPIPCIFRPYVI